MCLCSALGLGSESMQTHCLAPDNKGDLWGKGALEKEIPAVPDGLWSKLGLVESGKRERGREKYNHLNCYIQGCSAVCFVPKCK